MEALEIAVAHSICEIDAGTTSREYDWFFYVTTIAEAEGGGMVMRCRRCLGETYSFCDWNEAGSNQDGAGYPMCTRAS